MRTQLRIWTTLALVLSLPACTEQTDTNPCGIDSGYEGDELCMMPPAAADGLQPHVGPSNYDDPAEMEKYLLQPGEEITLCYYKHAPNEEVVPFFAQQYRMRPGSHHLIMYMNVQGAQREEGWGECENEGFTPIGGTQRSVSDFPPGETAAEDLNLFRPLLPKALMKFELHFVNTTDKPILRELWVNLLRKEVDDKSQILGGVFMIGGLNMRVEPQTTQNLNYSCTLNEPERRIVSLFGHRHAHADRFSVWVHRNGQRELVYEDYDWDEPVELAYNSVMQNPAPDRERGIAGGTSGILNLKQGDKIEWECEVNNTTNAPLTFKNEAYTGEMCNVFGSSVQPFGATPSRPIWYCAPERGR